MKLGRFILSATSAAALCVTSACTTVEGARPDIAAKPLPSRLDEIAYINALRAAYAVSDDEYCFTGEGLQAFKAKLSQGYRSTDDPENFLAANSCLKFKDVASDEDDAKAELTNYMAAGFGLTDIYCKRFFVVASEAQQNRQFGRNLNNGVDTLVGSILTLSGAGPTAIGITNGSFGLIDGTLEGFDLAYLVGPDMPEVERLVKAEQTLFKQTVFDENGKAFPSNYASARSVIEAYAGICSFTGMRQLVSKSVSDKTDTLNQKVEDKRNEGGQPGAGDGTPVPVGAPAPTNQPLIQSVIVPVG